MKLYIKTLVGKDRPTSIRKFIEHYYYTSEKDNSINTKATFKNKECEGNSHCSRQRMRSFDDIYYLTKTYYPSITPKKLMHLILIYNKKVLIKNYMDNTKMNTWYDTFRYGSCGGMKRVRLNINRNPNKPGTQSYSDIIYYQKYNSKWSWKELLGMLGITNQIQLETYINKHRKLDE